LSGNGTLYIVSAPSGAGKTSLLKALVEQSPWVRVAVSHTTRAQRPGERDGVDYRFVTIDRFEQMIRDEAFVEHARVFGNYYGTARTEVARCLGRGQDVILEIDWQGAQQVRKALACTRSIFILPPSLATLAARLHDRGQDDVEVIARRMRDAVDEIRHYDEFDYLIVNQDFSVALQELRAIITERRLRREQQEPLLQPLLRELLVDQGEVQ
jgi:guanylate kinase